MELAPLKVPIHAQVTSPGNDSDCNFSRDNKMTAEHDDSGGIDTEIAPKNHLKEEVVVAIARNIMTSPHEENNYLTRTNKKVLLLWVLLLPAFVEKVAERMSIPVIPVFAKDRLHASSTMIGSITAVVALGKMICNIPSGWLVSLFYQAAPEAVKGEREEDRDDNTEKIATKHDHFDYFLYPIILSCLILATAYIAASHSTTSLFLIMARLWEGAGLSLWVIGYQTLVNDLVTQQTRGRYMSTIGGMARLAAIVGPYWAGRLATNQLQFPFYGQAFLSFFNAIILTVIARLVSIRSVPSDWETGTHATQSNIHSSVSREGGQNAQRAETEGDMVSLLPEVDSPCAQTKETTAKATSQVSSSLETCQSTSPSSSSSSLSSSEPKKMTSWVRIWYRHGPELIKLSFLSFVMNVARESRHLLFPLRAMELGYNANDIGIMTSVTFVADSCMFPVAGKYATKEVGFHKCCRFVLGTAILK
jgi:MFS family permease